MVLKQNLSAMSEHNTQLNNQSNSSSAGAGLSDLQLAHSKKMSIAAKMKKQRRNRNSESVSPVPTQGPTTTSTATASQKSQVSERSTTQSESHKQQQQQPSLEKSKTTCNNSDNASSGTQAPPSSSSSSGGAGSSLLHNKRRAMQLAKTRRAHENQPRESAAAPAEARSPVRPVVAAKASHNNYKCNNNDTTNYPRTAIKEAEKEEQPNNDMVKSTTSDHAGVHTSNTKAPFARRLQQTARPMVGRKDPVPPNATSIKAEPAPAIASDSSLVSNSNDQNDLGPVESVESAESQPRSDISSYSKRGTSTIASTGTRCQEEAVPWETEQPDFDPHTPTRTTFAAPKSTVDDSDRFSQASTGKSVISNGVVAYDESIMSLARLDNFRSPANQAKADKKETTTYPGSYCGATTSSSGPPPQNLVMPPPSASEESVESLPGSAAKAASQVWKSSLLSEKRAVPVRAQSWRASGSSPFVPKDGNQEKRTSQAATTTKVPRNFSRQPSWVKPRPSLEQDAPASPTPSSTSNANANAQPVSPARSAYSSASFRLDRPGSPLITMPKFSSSVSDIGVAPSFPMPSGPRRESVSSSKSWKASPVVKKPSVVPPTKTSTGPSWQARNGRTQDSYTISPSPSQASEVEQASEKPVAATAEVPKAKSWSTKNQQPPSWTVRAASPSPVAMQSPPQHHVPASPLRTSGSSWMKPNNNALPAAKDVSDAKATASPALRPRSFASPPAIPKPIANRQFPSITDSAEHERTVPSPRRHSSPAPSWVKPKHSEQDDLKDEPTTPPVPTTKTWSVNKQTPQWMKKVQGEEEPVEKPPAPVPKTKVWSAKKQTPSWMKQQANDELDEEVEEDTSVTSVASTNRRNSTPSWMKPGQPGPPDNQERTPVPPKPTQEKPAVTSSPQIPQPWKRHSLGGPTPSTASNKSSPEDELQASPVPPKAAKTWRPLASSAEQKPSASPPRKPRSSPLTAEKATIGGGLSSGRTTGRQSIGGISDASTSKVPPAAALVKKQRCPSPSVAQLQEQIFVEKLGVAEKRSSEVLRAKGPSAPSPQVKQLQEKIFSPEKAKHSEQEERTVSPAAGWWKRVPNAPEIQSEHREAPDWKHEGSSIEESEISPSPPTAASEPEAQKPWNPSQPQEPGPGAPTWLKDIAAFHSSSSPTKLPSQPPIWQQPIESAPRPAMPSKLVDEGSADLMIMSSTSTTSRDDLKVHQEDTKSLTQMAADSVLVADYEQAMQRVIAESKSEDDDDSVGNSAGNSAANNTLPTELPMEFQKALTVEENDEMCEEQRCESPDQRNDTAQEEEVDTFAQNVSNHSLSEEKEQSDRNATNASIDDYEIEVDNGDCDEESPIFSIPTSPEETAEPSQKGSPTHGLNENAQLSEKLSPIRQELQLSKSDQVIEKSTSRPKIADRAKALLGWATGRGSPKKDKGSHEDKISHDTPEDISNEHPCVDLAQNEEMWNDNVQEIVHDVNASFDQVNASFDHLCGSFVQDENGFLCAPVAVESDFVDAFGSQPWTDTTGDDEKKDASDDIMQFWPAAMEIMNDSAEWMNRDPGLDSVAINSPEPVTTEKLVASAESMLQKWGHHVGENLLQDANPRQLHTSEGIVAEDDPAVDEWVDRSRISQSKDIQRDSDDMWGSHGFSNQELVIVNSQARDGKPRSDESAWEVPPPTQPPQVESHLNHQQNEVTAADPMWDPAHAIDATWGVVPSEPDPFSTSACHFNKMMASPLEDQKPRGDAFDPFGEDDDNFNDFAAEKLFSEPPEAFDSFSPPAFAPKYAGSQGADVFDTYYHPQEGAYGNHRNP